MFMSINFRPLTSKRKLFDNENKASYGMYKHILWLVKFSVGKEESSGMNLCLHYTYRPLVLISFSKLGVFYDFIPKLKFALKICS